MSRASDYSGIPMTDLSAISVADIDVMPADQARGLLSDCCGSAKWVNGMISRRPFKTFDRMLSAADDVADSLDSEDWLEAFAHHPRIGEQHGEKKQGEIGSEWSGVEQAGADAADSTARAEIASVNREYEMRFGHIYIVSATGKSAAELLSLARKRLDNDPEKELRVAADEQRKITKLRLTKMLAAD